MSDVAKSEKPYTANCEVLPGMVVPEGITRWALGVEYAGGVFRGFQAQPHDPQTVQGHLQRALSSIANEEITLVCAGRTDAGVHATGQVVHFDTRAKRVERAFTLGMNTQLPDQVAVRWAQPVPMAFHARFSARHRTYRYIIENTPSRPAIQNGLVTWDKRRLDVDAMAEAAGKLVGEHDFSSFRAAQCQARNPIRTIEYLTLERYQNFIVIEIRANAFLHHMVRNIVGVLSAIGAGEKPVSWVDTVLSARDRTQAGVTAPAAGLYLVSVGYPEAFTLPNTTPGPSFLPLPLHRS